MMKETARGRVSVSGKLWPGRSLRGEAWVARLCKTDHHLSDTQNWRSPLKATPRRFLCCWLFQKVWFVTASLWEKKGLPTLHNRFAVYSCF